MLRLLAALALVTHSIAAFGAVTPEQVEGALKEVDDDIIAWRRDIHQHPELSNREVRTSKVVADHLRKLGLTVKTGIA